ncbi:MAG: plasmid replication protein, CyRepA1 family [Gallionella sp.]
MLIAINRNIINKVGEDILKANNSTYENVDISIQDFANFVNQGFAFCAQHKNNWRKTSNFSASDFLAVDIDHGLTLEAAQEDEFFKQYASMIYTTPSHKPDAHRFRIVFELEETITDADRMRHALTGLIVRFGGDRNCKDPCRLFFGSSGSNPAVFGKQLPNSEVEKLVIRAQENRVRTASKSEDQKGLTAAVHSRINIPRHSQVVTEAGQSIALADLQPRTRIFCSQHVDNKPSAVTLRNRDGNAGFFCSTCNATFFLDDGKGNVWRDNYQFNYDWENLLNISLEEHDAYSDEDGRISVSEVRGGRIREINTRYLPIEDMSFDNVKKSEENLIANRDITFIKSPKGSGKTEWLARLVAACKKANYSVLLVGHRRSLISTTALRTGLTSYLGEAESMYGTDVHRTIFNAPTSAYAICLDSIPGRLDRTINKYDVVVIDEVEQVFSHLLSGTLKDIRREALHALQHYLRSAKLMYLLDADLNKVTIDVLAQMLSDKDRKWQAIINNWKPEYHVVEFYDSAKKDDLLGELVASIGRGERCFVCSNSKALIDGLHLEINKRCTRTLKTIVVTSENSQKPEIQEFIRNIKIQALQYDVIFTSPAMGTGIDITFENDEAHIDSVFGFFEARVNTHFDIDQQLARVRNPKRICVWITPEEFQFETDIEAIKGEIHAAADIHRGFIDIAPSGIANYITDELYEFVFATITAAQRASKNRLKKNFIDLREANGWTVKNVDKVAERAELGKDVRKSAKAERQRVAFERILQARQITYDEYRDFKRAEKSEILADVNKPLMRRYEIESFYFQDADIDLLEEDKDGQLRKGVRNYELLMAPDELLQKEDTYYSGAFTDDKAENLLRKQIMSGLLHKAGLMVGGKFDTDVVVDSSKLSEFADECIKDKVRIERLFQVDVRSDAKKKSVQQLSAILDWLYLPLTKPEIKQSNGKKKYYYHLNSKHINSLMAWADVRADLESCEKWRKTREGYGAVN